MHSHPLCRSQFDVYSFGLFYGHLYSRLSIRRALCLFVRELLIFEDAERDYRSVLKTIPIQRKIAIKYSHAYHT